MCPKTWHKSKVLEYIYYKNTAMPEKQQNLNVSEIKQMMDNTRNLQNKAAQTLESAISGRIPIFDPRSSDAQEENTDAAVIWSTKSIELAYKALKDGYRPLVVDGIKWSSSQKSIK